MQESTYQQETQVLQHLLKALTLEPSKLPSNIQTDLSELSQAVQSLGIRNFNQSSIIKMLNQFCCTYQEMVQYQERIQDQNSEMESSRILLKSSWIQKTKLSAFNEKLETYCEENVYKQLDDLENQIKLTLQPKNKQYKSQLKDLEKKNIYPEATEQFLELSRQLDDLEDECRKLEKEEGLFSGLPADIEQASNMLKLAKTKQKDLENDIQDQIKRQLYK